MALRVAPPGGATKVIRAERLNPLRTTSSDERHDALVRASGSILAAHVFGLIAPALWVDRLTLR